MTKREAELHNRILNLRGVIAENRAALSEMERDLYKNERELAALQRARPVDVVVDVEFELVSGQVFGTPRALPAPAFVERRLLPRGA